MDIEEGHHLPASRCFHGGISQGAVGATVPEIGLLLFSTPVQMRRPRKVGDPEVSYVCVHCGCLPVDSIKTPSLSIASLGEG